MTATRRTFIKVVAASGGALVLGVRFADAAEETKKGFQPNAWVRIEPDGTIVVRVGKSEMGQGVRTSLPMILAEELDVPIEAIRIEQASPGASFKGLGTGGSFSIMALWDPLRNAGAAARMMLVAAAAARWNVDAASLRTSDGAVIDPAGNRKLTYAQLAAEAASQPVPDKPVLKSKKDYRLLGQAKKRIDGKDIVTGRAVYGLDQRLPGMLFAVVARPPKLGGGVAKFDASAAEQVSGVRKVLQIPTGVAVVADSTWAALRGREALVVEWTDGPNASFQSSDHMKALHAAVEKPGITTRKDGDGRAAFASATKTVDATYSYPFAAHAALEPVNCTVLAEEGKATVWSPTQTPNSVHGAAAEILAVPLDAVQVNVLLLGGGFGRRLGVDFDREALNIARQMKGTPVQLVWSREDDMRHGYFQAASVERLIAGLDGGGNVVAWEHRKACTPHNARRKPTPEQLADSAYLRGSSWGIYDTPYFVPAMEMTYSVVEAPVPIGPWRAVYSPSSVFAREAFVDEVAQQLGIDPLQFRLRHLRSEHPAYKQTITVEEDETVDRERMARVLESVAEKAGWSSPVPAGRARGLACNVFHTGTYVAYVVEVSLRKAAAPDELPFRVDRVVCAVDCGVVINPLGVAQQVESGVIWSLSNMKSEITVRDGSIEQEHYTDFPVVMIQETPAVIETHIVASDDERPRGLGEPTVCPLAPAVVNALSRLAGKRIRRLPVRAGDLA